MPLLVPEDKRSMSRVLLSPSVSVLRGLGIPPRVQAALDQIEARRERLCHLEKPYKTMHGAQAPMDKKTATYHMDSGQESVIIREFPRLEGNRNSSVQPHPQHRQGLVYMYSTKYLGHQSKYHCSGSVLASVRKCSTSSSRSSRIRNAAANSDPPNLITRSKTLNCQ